MGGNRDKRIDKDGTKGESDGESESGGNDGRRARTRARVLCMYIEREISCHILPHRDHRVTSGRTRMYVTW